MNIKRWVAGFGLGWAVMASGGHRHGNGGDHVRGTFIKLGAAAISYLEETEQGANLVKNHGLSTSQLRDLNNIDVISVAEGTLIDNNGSKVEAIGEPGKILLAGDLWMDHFEHDRDVTYLVFHELLRAAGIDDDNYVISSALNPFPLARKVVTRLNSLYPLLGDDLLADVVDPDKIGLAGTGCPRGLTGTIFEFDEERNVLDISFERYAMVTSGTKPVDRKNCAIVIPIKGRYGKRIVMTQIDFTAKVHMPASAPAGSSAKLILEAFLPGSTAPTASRQVLANGQEQVGRILVRKTEAVKSPCGESTLLRVNTTGHSSNSGDSLALVDADHLSIFLGVEDCSTGSSAGQGQSSQNSKSLGQIVR